MGGAPFEQALAAIKRRLVETLEDDASRIAQDLAALDRAETNAAAVAQLRRIGHRLSGAGGTLGFLALSRAAADLERAAESSERTWAAGDGVSSAARELLSVIATIRSEDRPSVPRRVPQPIRGDQS
jgi:HPt (histidine-containing phosphotransfer) domain-containing protein